MKVSEILNYETVRLKLIGSKKDPALFQTFRKMHSVGNPKTMNRSIIVNWAGPSGEFGCRFSCQFCSWRDRAVKMGAIFPSEKALDKFLSNYEGYKVTISGGGDPLFNFDENKGRLLGLVRLIHDRGFLVEVVTKEISLVLREHDGELKEIDMWSFSTESISKLVAEAIRAVKMARVSKVCTPGTNIDLRRYIDFYGMAGAYQIILREDFYERLEAAEMLQVLRSRKSSTHGSITKWLMNSVCSNNYFLINDEVYIGDAALGGFPDSESLAS